jgi:hypothetical protein
MPVNKRANRLFEDRMAAPFAQRLPGVHHQKSQHQGEPNHEHTNEVMYFTGVFSGVNDFYPSDFKKDDGYESLFNNCETRMRLGAGHRTSSQTARFIAM